MATTASKNLKDRIATLEEFEEMMADPKKGKELPEHLEIVEGIVVKMSPSKPRHGSTASRIHALLAHYVYSNDLGEMYIAEAGFELKEEPLTLRCPDVAFLTKENIPTLEEEDDFVKGAPDLAIEVISPSNTAVEINDKIGEYFEAGSKLIWVVYPNRKTVQVHKVGSNSVTILSAEDEITGEDVVPGFSCKVSQFFR